jgi:hypothetical protein
MTTPLIREIVKYSSDAGMDPVEMMWFDVSNGIEAVNNNVQKHDWLLEYRPPFEKSLVVYRGPYKEHDNYEAFFMVVGDDPEEGILVTMYRGPYGKPTERLPILVYAVDGGVVRFGAMEENETMTEEEGRFILGWLTIWYSSLSLGSDTYSPSVVKSFTNKRKIAQGKVPTYDWRTVKLAPSKPRVVTESQGGTHASPRLHDRRGHLRRLRSGKNVWVKACKVGDASKGVVFKDYEVVAA